MLGKDRTNARAFAVVCSEGHYQATKQFFEDMGGEQDARGFPQWFN